MGEPGNEACHLWGRHGRREVKSPRGPKARTSQTQARNSRARQATGTSLDPGLGWMGLGGPARVVAVMGFRAAGLVAGRGMAGASPAPCPAHKAQGRWGQVPSGKCGRGGRAGAAGRSQGSRVSGQGPHHRCQGVREWLRHRQNVSRLLRRQQRSWALAGHRDPEGPALEEGAGPLEP